LWGLNQGLSSLRFVHSIDTVVAVLYYVSIQSKDIDTRVSNLFLCPDPFLAVLYAISGGLLVVMALR